MASIFTNQVPSALQVADSTVSLGVVFYVDAEVTIESIKYWKSNSAWDNVPVVVGIWNPANEFLSTGFRVQLAGDSVGWVTVPLDSAILVNNLGAGNLYTAAIKTPGVDLGNYSYTANGLLDAIDNAPFHTPVAAGRFDYGPALQRPTNAVNTNYFVDPVSTEDVPEPSVGSLGDKARGFMLTELGLTEPRPESNVDLMKLILDDPEQSLVTKTDASVGVHLYRYYKMVRDS